MSYTDNRATSWRIQWKFLWHLLVCRKFVAVISTIRGSLEVVSTGRVVRSLVTLAVVFSLTSWPASLYVVC